MILPFQLNFKNGTPTEFVSKIWAGIVNKNLVSTTEVVKFFKELTRPQSKFMAHVDATKLVQLPRKIHTIREDPKDRWHAGCKIHMVVFNRSKNQFQFAPILKCKSVQIVEIKYPTQYLNDVLISVDGVQLTTEGKQQLAWNDGFDCLIHFLGYFNADFTGKIIHWTDLKY